MFVERSARRYQVRLPVKDGEHIAFTRDISTAGIFFETPRAHAVGEEVGLETQFDDTRVRYAGRVVRVESINEHYGVAVALTSYRFD